MDGLLLSFGKCQPSTLTTHLSIVVLLLNLVVIGRNEHNRYHHHSLNSGEKLRDIFNRSTTPMHEQQINKQGKLRARLKPGVLLPMGLGERYSIEIMK